MGTSDVGKRGDEGYSGQEPMDVGRKEVIEALLVLLAWPQKLESGKNRRLHKMSPG